MQIDHDNSIKHSHPGINRIFKKINIRFKHPWMQNHIFPLTTNTKALSLYWMNERACELKDDDNDD